MFPYAWCLRSFGGKCFIVLSTNLSVESLEELETIAHNEHLARSVQKLRIAPSPDADAEGKLCLGDSFDWPRRSNGVKRFPTEGTQVLQEIMRHRIPTCRPFEIVGRDVKEDPTYGDLCDTDVVSIVLNLVSRA